MVHALMFGQGAEMAIFYCVVFVNRPCLQRMAVHKDESENSPAEADAGDEEDVPEDCESAETPEGEEDEETQPAREYFANAWE